MIQRDLEKELLQWKNSSIRKVLIVRGARQVGKTSVIRKFGEENFEQLVEINLENKEQLMWFSGVLSIDDFAKRVELYLKRSLVDEKTLLFIDEVQESSDILALLRFFAEERSGLHVIVAGSLLEVKMMGKWSVPVGRVEYMHLFPLNFGEYLQAAGESQWRKYLETIRVGQEVIGTAEIKKLYAEYLLVGGMPEAVVKMVQGGLREVEAIHERLMDGYRDDIGKYASSAERKYLELVMRMAPALAGGLFKYENMGESGYGSREIGEAVYKLQQTMLLTQVAATNSTTMPIFPKLKRPKKMIWLDTGLVNHDSGVRQEIFAGNYQGRLMEQTVGQALLSENCRRRVELLYWSRDRNEGSAEVDFVVQEGQKLVAFEVKAGNGRAMKSMFSLMNDGGEMIVPVRVSWDGPKWEEYRFANKKYRILSLPFYLLKRWREFTS